MKKVFIGILVVLMIFFAGFLLFGREEESLTADVARTIDYGLLVNYENELILVNTSGADIFDRSGKKNTVDCIKEGDKIEVIYDGNIEEGWPAKINKVYKVKLLETH